jgi:hypothetical protein
MAEHATEAAGKVDETKQSKSEMRYRHPSNHKKPNESGKMAEGGEGSPKTAGGPTENKGDGAPHSPLAQIHAAHEAAHDAMDAKHKTERESLHRTHEANLAQHGHRPDVHATHQEQRSRMHRHHADEKRGLNDQHALDHLQGAGIHGGVGLGAGSPEGATAGQGAPGGAGPSSAPVMAGMGGGASGGTQVAAAGQPQPPMGGAPAAAMA